MLKTKFLSAIAQIVFSIFLMSQIPPDLFSATCTGADPCHACKNCHYCRHCAKEGGKCGVCK
jgi:hypothetical protein